MNIIIEAIAAVIKKATEWTPTRRESLNNTIDKLKKELLYVQSRKPFDAVKYQRLLDKLSSVEALERRAS